LLLPKALPAVRQLREEILLVREQQAATGPHREERQKGEVGRRTVVSRLLA
jgi:hypothetical protein